MKKSIKNITLFDFKKAHDKESNFLNEKQIEELTEEYFETVNSKTYRLEFQKSKEVFTKKTRAEIAELLLQILERDKENALPIILDFTKTDTEKKARTKANRYIVEYRMLQKDIQKNEKKETENEYNSFVEYLTKTQITVSKENGFWIDDKKCTVYEFALMVNDYLNRMELLNKQNKQNKKK